MTEQFGVLTFKQPTVLKPGPEQSSTYPSNSLKEVHEGYRLFIESYAPCSDPNHYEVVVAVKAYPKDWIEQFHPSKRQTWYVYKRHIHDISGLNPSNNPKDKGVPEPAASSKDRGILLRIRGREVWSNDAISADSPNFTWREALHVQSSGRFRNPASSEVLVRIEGIAKVMQQIRDRYKRVITVNSWYRDPATNLMVGGASGSRHLSGDAVDFTVQGMSTRQVFQDLNAWWGSKGGLAYHPAFVHIDSRGWKARWNY
jgi:hypothetical protein